MRPATLPESHRLRHITFFAEGTATVEQPRRWRPAAKKPALAPPAVTAEGFFAWVLQRAGLQPRDYRAAPLERRLAACLRALRVQSTEEAKERIARQPELIDVAVGTLLIGVTEFFRDDCVFDCLRRAVMPALAASASRPRIWSAGCSDGAELYSVAMMLDRIGLLDRSELLGTDCRQDAIRRAAEGWISPAELGEIPLAFRGDYIANERRGLRLSSRLRRATQWRTADLLGPQQPADGVWDVVLCRNVAIYLGTEAVRRLWPRLVNQLRRGGFLVAGKAERPEQHVPLRRIGPCVYIRL